MKCIICDAEIDLNQPVKYVDNVPYVECECGWRMYAEMNSPDEEPEEDECIAMAIAQGYIF